MATRPSGAARQTLPDSRPTPGKRGREPDSPDTRSPTSPRSAGPLTRKRAASLRTDPRIEDLSLNTPTTSTAPSNTSQQQQQQQQQQHPHHPVEKVKERELICLCTPAPKVPRPRNAFILYRQHHQANVVAQNPGLANPEISKIIGERWRDESDENKDQWKRLAEEEKQRHQRQYPDYRYQPRRGGKGSTAGQSRAQTPIGSEGDPGRCPKCGGRYIATPRTPGVGASGSTASASYQFKAAAEVNQPGTGSMSSTSSAGYGAPREMDHRGGPPGQGSFVGYGPPPQQHGAHHMGYPPHHLHGIPEDYEMASPSEKRRRYDSYAGDIPMQHPDSRQPSVAYGAQPGYPYPYPYPPHMRQPPPLQQAPQQSQYARRGSVTSSGVASPAYPPPNPGPLPGPSLLGRGSVAANMAPPPRPGGSVAYPPPTGRREAGTPAGGGGFDESLRLPPLQTAVTGPPGQTSLLPPLPPHHGPTSQGASPISDNASAIAPTPHRRQSGVEGMIMSIPYMNKLKVLEKISPPLPPPDSTPVETRGPVIAIEGPVPSLVKQVGAIVERALAASGECAVRSWSSSSKAEEDKEAGKLKFASYLQIIMEWHSKSDEIVNYITHHVHSPSRRSSDIEMTEGGGGGETSKPSSPPKDTPSSSSTTSGDRTTVSPSASKTQAHLPVALLTDGFSLTLSDRFACRVPISDSYAPVDHWQWMATLWRGIVGPDLVVYVRPAEEGEMRDGRLQAVELKGPGVMMVRVVGEEGRVGEKVERRLGFEVVEWVRNGSFKEGF